MVGKVINNPVPVVLLYHPWLICEVPSWIQDGCQARAKNGKGGVANENVLCRFASPIRKEKRIPETSQKHSLTFNGQNRVLWPLFA